MQVRRDAGALPHRQRPRRARRRLGASVCGIRGRRDETLRRIEARRDDAGRPRETQHSAQRPQRIRDHRLRQPHILDHSPAAQTARPRVDKGAAGQAHQPRMHHEKRDLTDRGRLRREPRVHVPTQNPAHLRRPIRPRTAQIVVRRGDPQLPDRRDVRGRSLRYRRLKRERVPLRQPGIVICHAATLAGAFQR